MKRSEIRENVFKLIFCSEFHSPDELPQQMKRFFEETAVPDEETWQPQFSEEEQAVITERFNDISGRIPELDEKIDEAASGWSIDRMGRAELAILRLAVYEMLYDEDVPVKVAINEAVELAKKFCGDNASAFVNGILGKLA